MDRLVFKKIELWIVGLLVVLGLVMMIAFGNIVVHTMKGGTKAGELGETAVAVSDIPGLLRRMDENQYLMVPEQVHRGKSGFNFNYEAGARPDAGYLLLSRYDGDDRRPYVELIDLNAQKVLHRWAPDIDAFHEQAKLEFNLTDLAVDKSLDRMLIRHPYVLEDGGLLIKSVTPLYRTDACAKLVWVNDDDIFHHAIERDGDGIIWAATHQEPPTIDHVDPETFQDDSIAAVSPEGKLLSNRSVSAILLANNMPNYVFGALEYDDNPIHLNDVQPVLEDGPYWKKGDLFLSMRTPSMLALYRPSTNKILWHQVGPWIHQHDVDILDDHRIAVHNNNDAAYVNPWGQDNTVEVNIVDFETGETSSPWKDALHKLDVRAHTEGLMTVLPDNELFLEEQNYGRIFRMTADGEIVWEYVNRAEMGRIFRVGWSRLLSPEYGKQVADAVAKANCDGAATHVSLPRSSVNRPERLAEASGR